MKFALRGLARGKGDVALCSDTTASIASPAHARKPLEAKVTRQLLEGLTAQQASLARAVVLGDADYLNHSFYVDPETGKRIAHEINEEEICRFASSWAVAPIEWIRAMNRAIRAISDPARRERYVRSAVEVEILMDQQSWAGRDGEVYRGIPSYLMNGYTDMGTLASPTERNGREKIKVDKERMRNRLAECKREGIEVAEPGLDVLSRFYEAVRRDIEFDEQGVEKLSREFGSESIVLSEYLDKRMGVCRHLAIFFQLYLQEAGIASRVVKGNLQFYVFTGRHAWNMVQLGEGVALVDVTHPNVSLPFIIVGSNEEDAYRRTQDYARSYLPTPDEGNFYKIGA